MTGQTAPDSRARTPGPGLGGTTNTKLGKPVDIRRHRIYQFGATEPNHFSRNKFNIPRNRIWFRFLGFVISGIMNAHESK